MGYLLLGLRTAFTRSLSVAQDFIFVAIILVGFLIWWWPSMTSQLSAYATALNGWTVAAIVLATIFAIRLLLAPIGYGRSRKRK
jgi:hypothetical protein